MKEEYLHYIWQYGLFELSDLETTKGESIVILSNGIHNKNAGPDFLDAKIKIGETLWVGNVELHIKASDWLKHQHQNDPAYNNVILHVVLLDDKELKNANGASFPTLSLSKRISIDHFNRYKDLINNTFKVPCENQLSSIDDITIQVTLERMGISRLERKTKEILKELDNNKNDWRKVYFQMLAKNFGMKVNAIPCETLAKSIHLNYLERHLNNPLQVEAMLFGQSGLLDQVFTDEYPRKLQKEYNFLKEKYGLVSISRHMWKFMRMRPANFPTVRIAQMAAFLIKNKGLKELNFQSFNFNSLKSAFDFEVNPYWNNKYQFEKPTIAKSKKFGKSSFNNVVINSVVPILFAYGKSREDQKMKDLALDILCEIPREKNNIVDYWKKIGIHAKNAFETQALLELHNQLCLNKKCLNCTVGAKLLEDVVLND